MLDRALGAFERFAAPRGWPGQAQP